MLHQWLMIPFLGFMGIAWFVLWSYLYSQIRPRCVYSNTSFRRPNEVRSSHETNISTITQRLIDIPWTKLCTSMPVYAIVVSNIIDSWSSAFQYILEAINERIDDKVSKHVYFTYRVLHSFIFFLHEHYF